MFPLAHNLLITRLLANPAYDLAARLSPLQTKLLKVGGIMPDLVSGFGMERNYGHEMGKAFYQYLAANHPEYCSFGLGMWLHGTDPCGFDYYADEHWQQGPRGWCFQKCTPYIPRVIKACNLPEKWGLWKGHNFVEMAAELEAIHAYPNLSDDLLEARNDHEVIAVVTQLLTEFAEADPTRIPLMVEKVDEIFALKGVTADSLAEKYSLQLVNRHQIHGSDVAAMAGIIRDMQAALKEEFWQWLQEVEGLIQTAISQEHTILTQKTA